MNKQKHLKEAVTRMISIGATAKNDEEIAKAIHSLPRRDRRLLMREGQRAREQKNKQLGVEK